MRCRNDLRRLTRKLRKDFEQNLADEIKTNSKAFWRYANTRMKTRSTIENLVGVDGVVASADVDKAKVLNSFFSSVFSAGGTSTTPDCVTDNDGVPPLEVVDFSTSLVNLKMAKLRPSSSPGPDGLHPRLLAATAGALAGHWSQLFTESMELGSLPDDWKTAHVTPIFKKGNKQAPSNYRPITDGPSASQPSHARSWNP